MKSSFAGWQQTICFEKKKNKREQNTVWNEIRLFKNQIIAKILTKNETKETILYEPIYLWKRKKLVYFFLKFETVNLGEKKLKVNKANGEEENINRKHKMQKKKKFNDKRVKILWHQFTAFLR